MAATSSLVTSLALAIAGVNALPTTIIPQTIIVARTIVLETDIFNILYGFIIFLSLNFVKALISAFVGITIEDLRLAERTWLYRESHRGWTFFSRRYRILTRAKFNGCRRRSLSGRFADREKRLVW